MKNSIKDIEEEIVDEFNMFENWIDKYDYLIDLGKSLPKIDNEYNCLLYTSPSPRDY